MEDVEVVLRLVAFNGGNIAASTRAINEDYHISVHPNTVSRWINTHFPRRYVQIQNELADDVENRVAGKLGDLSMRSAQTQERLLDELDNQLARDQLNERETPVKDLAPAIRNIAQANQSNIQQQRLLRDKPTSIVETRTIDETIAYLERENLLIDLPDSEIVDVDDAD